MFKYYILNPTGNITALVIDEGIAKSDYSVISDFIMKKHCDVEQVGFVKISGETPYLRMAGGEFCGNATMSTAVLYCMETNIVSDKIAVEVFGNQGYVNVDVTFSDGDYRCAAELPKPLKFTEKNYIIGDKSYCLPRVDFSGISHIIADIDFDRDIATQIIKKYAKEDNLKAMGLMLLDKSTFDMIPIVYVTAEDTLFFENSCASGSCAVFSDLNKDADSPNEIALKQPGGTLRVSYSDNKENIKLCGNVRISEQYFGEL